MTEFQTDGGSGTSYADAGTLSGDVVLTQTQYIYDGDGNMVETITSDRFNTDSTTATGALGTPTSGVEARVYYSGNYYDAADRLVASVDVGTNEGSAWTMPDIPPARSDDALVTTYGYDADAVQWVTLSGSPTGGTFTLTFGGDTTSSIAYNASASTVQSDLAALGSIGSGNVEVTLVPDSGWQVHFTGSLAGVYQDQMTVTSSLTGGSAPTAWVTTISLGGDNGDVVGRTDPDGIDSRDYYNSVGQVLQEVQDYTDGAVTADSNKTTDYTYNSVGMTSLTADMGNGTGETTAWIYGVTTGTGSVIDSNDIVGVTEQPNPSTGLPDSSLETTMTVDGLGEILTSTDPNGTTHTYTYDVLGQQTADTASFAPGDPADETETQITTSYTTLGNPYLITTYDGSTVSNQVEDVYNGLDQLTQEYQVDHVVGVGTPYTYSVQYIYSDLADGNNSRLTEIIYPDGYTVDYNYASGLDNNISRLTSISDFTGTLESYKYLGLNTVVEMDHPETEINLTYISQDGETGVAGDQYTGLDQFGRVIEQNWYDTATSSAVYDEKYGFDNDGNVVWEIDGVNAYFGAIYQYDGLGQVTSYWQGDVMIVGGVVGISGSPTVNETWTYDPLGNHLVDSTTTSSGTTTVTSTFNFDNQITSMTGYTTPTYDAAGNMTTEQNDLTCAYNAWGQLTSVENSSGTVLQDNIYNGLGELAWNNRSWNIFIYSSDGQVLEETGAIHIVRSTTVAILQRYVWSPAYVNEMVDGDTDSSGSTGLTATGTNFTRYWAVQDANYDVVAIVTVSDSVASVVERYEYDPFGTRTVLSPSYVPESGSSYNWGYGFQGMSPYGVTGNYLSLTREEDPTTGTWTSEDPLGFGGGDQDLYGMEGNGPIGLLDPQGTDPFDWLARQINRSEAKRGRELDQRIARINNRPIPDAVNRRIWITPKTDIFTCGTAQWHSTAATLNSLQPFGSSDAVIRPTSMTDVINQMNQRNLLSTDTSIDFLEFAGHNYNVTNLIPPEYIDPKDPSYNTPEAQAVRAAISQLAAMMGPDAIIKLNACYLGAHPTYIQNLSNAFGGRPVLANTGSVSITGAGYWKLTTGSSTQIDPNGWDVPIIGQWLVFNGAGDSLGHRPPCIPLWMMIWISPNFTAFRP